MLILFDVDATLITTSRAGIAAMGLAGRERYGPAFDESRVSYAGRLDPLIIADLLRAHAVEVSDEEVSSFRRAYREHLERLLRTPGLAKPCPGVLDLLAALETRGVRGGAAGEGGGAMGLLTGNYPETGAIKLRASGVDPDRFIIQVWGCDSPHAPPSREHLPAVGMLRYKARFGRPIDPARVTVIGDTPLDIGCAKAAGCRSLGVATGPFGVEDLHDAGADLALPDLSETSRVLEWLLLE